ncbi:MAG: hypothetical protein ACREO4_06110 [Lysobacter sp.]
MACFWTDLVGLDQECGTAPPAQAVDVRVDNGNIYVNQGDIDPIPDWFDPVADLTLTIDGGGTFLYVYDVGSDRFEGDNLSGLGGDTVTGTLSQGSNSAPAEISVILS